MHCSMRISSRPGAASGLASEGRQRNSGGAGLRKVRWLASGHGKRGGIRVIYYFRVETDRLFLIYAYRKNECEDLTKAQIKNLAAIIDLL